MFSESERQIFKFHDGTQDRAVDPLAVWRQVRSYPDLDIQADIARADAGDPKSEGMILDAVRAAFGIERFGLVDGSPVGLLDAEVLDIFGRFGEFLGELQKKMSKLPTLPSATAEESSDANSTTPPSSDST